MKFSCEKALLASAVSTASRAVAAKSSITALECILLEAGERLYLTGYNLEIGIQVAVSADVQQSGQLILPARLFGEIVRKLPDDIVFIFSEEDRVEIRCGMSEFHLQVGNPEDFPELPVVEQVNKLVLPQSLLRAMITQTLFAVSGDESRPILTGALFDVHYETGLTIVTVDGYRLALRRESKIQIPDQAVFSFIVPGTALSEAEKICSGEEDVIITQGDRHIMFRIGSTTLICRRLEGEFLVYQNAIPRNQPIAVEVETRELLRSVERVSLLINDKLKSPLRCIFGDNRLILQSKTSIGEATDQCPIVGNGEELEIGFNNRYILDALKAAPAERLRLELQSNLKPCIILPAEGEEIFLYMILPVRLGSH